MENYSEGKQVYIRKLIEEDYPVCKEINYSHFTYKKVFTEKVMQGIWEEVNASNVLSCAIVEKSTAKICGFCQLRNIDTPTPEIGIDIGDEYMGKGYAQEAIRLLISYASQHHDVDYFVWKARHVNSVSLHIAEKLGGQLVSKQPTLSQDIIDYAKENGILKDEDISYICTYIIEKETGTINDFV